MGIVLSIALVRIKFIGKCTMKPIKSERREKRKYKAMEKQRLQNNRKSLMQIIIGTQKRGLVS